ncbi:syntaxin-61-like isoform X2 [Abrus precatorius]|uniref:Syntaxin-61-like isoform X2 n=1 Tax=Abrus precatorius TaxID=3816 RepID=A0A8B8JQW4_ABRPR|nr:syntaxin-61-like isoform X2 [Abrus precatorius]
MQIFDFEENQLRSVTVDISNWSRKKWGCYVSGCMIFIFWLINFNFVLRLISCNLLFTNGKTLLILGSDQIFQRKFLLLVKVLNGRKVDELDKAIAVASRDPSWYGIDEVELESRRRWTSDARTQVSTVKKAVEVRKGSNTTEHASVNGMHRELMRLPNSHQTTSDQYAAQDNDDFIESESDRQMLLIKKQDEELDELSLSVQRIGGVGLTIHDELLAQEKIVDELGNDMDSTSNRLDFVQVKKSGNGHEEG